MLSYRSLYVLKVSEDINYILNNNLSNTKLTYLFSTNFKGP